MPQIINYKNKSVKQTGVQIVFLGTGQFAVLILEKLTNSEFKPIAVFCAPDKPVGRKQILTPPPVKIVAQKYNIPVYQPKNKSELINMLYSLTKQEHEDAPSVGHALSEARRPALREGQDRAGVGGRERKACPTDGANLMIISAAYGIILPKEILELPEFGCLNIHPSLLPKYRGPSPIQYAILNGDTETGVSIIKMTEKIDAGSIIKSSKLKVKSLKLTTPELSQELSIIGADLLLEILPDYLAGKITPQPQDKLLATHTKILKKQDGQINWKKSAQEIERQIRAFAPWPGSYSFFTAAAGTPSKMIKIIGGRASQKNSHYQPGQVFLTNNRELAAQCGQGHLIIDALQLEGGKPLSASAFLDGHQYFFNQTLD